MFELGKRSFLFHPPVVVKSPPEIGKLLFWSALGHFVDPGKLPTLDLVVLRLEVFHLHPSSLGAIVLPASKRPIVGMTGHSTGLAKIHLLFLSWIEPDHVRAIHPINLLSTLRAWQQLHFPALFDNEPVLAVQAYQSSL